MEKAKGRITYANVMATIALFVALGGGAYAAATAKKNSVTSKSVKNGSIQGVDVGKDTLTGDNINESSLNVLPTCPSGTTKAAGICFESTERGAQGLDGAMTTCGQANRYLPTLAELRTLHAVAGVSVFGEQASDIASDTSHSALGTDSGLAISNDTSFGRAFRCAVVPG
jgi:hypothetical protein